MADDALVLRVIREAGRRARGEPLAGLGHPVAVDAKLAEHLEAATAHRTAPQGGRRAQIVNAALEPVLDQQGAFNEAVIEVLHQLDHRTRAQQERIRDLEAELDRLRRPDGS